MTRRLLSILTVLCLSLMASFAMADDLPEPLHTALLEAEQNKKARFSFTQSFKWLGHDPIVERFDARTKTWTLISGNPKALDKKGKKKLKNWKRIESAPGGLVYADYRSSFKNTKLFEENTQSYVYAFSAGQHKKEKLDGSHASKVSARSVIDKETGIMTSYSIKALEGFKPNAFSNLEAFEMTHSFARPAEGVPAVMTRVYWRAKGKQMGSKIDEEITILYNDFELVE